MAGIGGEPRESDLDTTRRRLLLSLGAAAGAIVAAGTAGAGRRAAPDERAALRLGLVTATADGSVGQTYSGPAWTGIQWYRETLASPKARTAIAGAHARTHVATAADNGFRLVMAGMDAGAPRRAPAYGVVLAAPIVLWDFDALADPSEATAANLALTRDPAGTVRGVGSVVATGRGSGSRLVGRLGPLSEIAGVGDLAGLGTLAWLKQELNPYASASLDGSIRLDQTAGRPSSRGGMQGARIANAHKGRIWNSVRPDQLSSLRDKDPAKPWAVSFDRSSASNAPHAQRTRYGALLAKAGCRPALILGFDDAIRTQRMAAVPELVARGLLATFYLPTALVEDSNGTGRLTWADVRYLAGLGMDLQLDGTADDTAMTSRPDPAAALAELRSMRDLVMARVPGSDPRHFCYPNGFTDSLLAAKNAHDHRAYAGAATGAAGSAVLAGLARTSTLSAGMAVSGFGVPAGTRIASVDGAAEVTLTRALTADTASIAVWDDRSPFFLDKLQDALRSDGTFRTGRTTGFDTFHSRFGIADRAFLLPAYSMSNGSTGSDDDAQLAARILARIDHAVARRENIEFYVHGVQAQATFITTPLATWIAVLDGIAARRDAGVLDVLTKAQWWARDGSASCPV
ncbi:hypothetical protein D3218_13955 [Aureimonas flava]|uniref:Nodulation protein B n=1 Tax=Aureimonas flava TaxID=2320271 RepID=A0A3A1WIV4_9HYPH|nr:polysaccharide deacetylase family protein [Aureimonas flava]RIX99572.1 hypothetical protein D3218_13955 [Aureimonas flava]